MNLNASAHWHQEARMSTVSLIPSKMSPLGLAMGKLSFLYVFFLIVIRI